MSSILDRRTHTVSGSSSPLTFSDDRSGDGPWRSLVIDGKPAYDLGTMCDTCSFIFERMSGANQSLASEEIAAVLRDGIAAVDEELVRAASGAIPDGEYTAALLEVMPKLVWPGNEDDYFSNEQLELWEIDPFWGLPHSPRVPYYRTETRPARPNAVLFEFVIPMFPPRWLDDEVVADYRTRIERGERPTALGVSVLDVRQPATWEGEGEITQHWCLAHFILDGNHKMYAAARVHASARLLTFISLDWSIATQDEVDHAMELLAAAQ